MLFSVHKGRRIIRICSLCPIILTTNDDLGHNEHIRIILRPLCTETVIRYWVLFFSRFSAREGGHRLFLCLQVRCESCSNLIQELLGFQQALDMIACEQALRAKKNEEKARRKESLHASLRNLNTASKFWTQNTDWWRFNWLMTSPNRDRLLFRKAK